MNKVIKYIQEARERAKRRKSPWNLILIPLTIVGFGFSSFIQFKILWSIHVIIYPNHSGRLSEFWREGLSFSAFISSFLLAMPIFFSSLALGMMIANLLAWCILPARKIFDKEAQGIRGASFNEAMKGLGKIAIYLVPICFILGLIGAVTLKSLR
ncbi:MAG: hypothetical protein Q8O13_05015 [Candidatus Omnitrophota bacterium]|nr:hypothetical protein [Candidatus Omnitrophota bacterium]